MTNLLVRNVPADVHAALSSHAEAAGQSLQQYLQAELARLAQRPTMAKILDRLDANAATELGVGVAVALVREGRDDRR